jgi:uncharacterized DUF497 family protein
MECVWDAAKAAANVRKHGVPFQDACVAVNDPARVEWFDDRFYYDQPRLCIVGASPCGVLFVVAVEGHESCRIISARKATRLEEQAYYARSG